MRRGQTTSRAVVTLGAVAALAAAPAEAQAGSARVSRITDRNGNTSETVTYRAGRKERNDVRAVLRFRRGRGQGEEVRIRDSVRIVPGPGCSRPVARAPRTVLCFVSHAGAVGVSLRLRDRDDRAVMLRALPPVGCSLLGGGGRDSLASRTDCAFDGGPGNDRLNGGEGSDSFAEGLPGSGSDTILGGAGHDTVSYEGRRRSVHADLEGDRDDGVRGERDRIGSDVEDLTGGGGNDRLVGNRRINFLQGNLGSDVLIGGGRADQLYAWNAFSESPPPELRTRNVLSGGAGNDHLEGDTGADRLEGGRGRDGLDGNAGSDVFAARDGDTDTANCGEGHDLALLDRYDFPEGDLSPENVLLSAGCEQIRRRGPAVAVPLQIDCEAVDDTPFCVYVGCPPDAPPVCVGRVQILWRGRAIGSQDFSIERGELDGFDMRPPRALYRRLRSGRTIKLTARVSSRDSSGRLQTLTRSSRLFSF